MLLVLRQFFSVPLMSQIESVGSGWVGGGWEAKGGLTI